jgi:hypothetical protein
MASGVWSADAGDRREEEGRGGKLTATISEWPGADEGDRRGHCSLLPAGSIRFQDRITDWAAAAYGVRTVTNYGSNRC